MMHLYQRLKCIGSTDLFAYFERSCMKLLAKLTVRYATVFSFRELASRAPFRTLFQGL